MTANAHRFSSLLKLVVGNGKAPLKECYPSLYLIARDRKGTVAGYLEYKNGSFFIFGIWCLVEVHDWDIEQMAPLLEDIYATKICIWEGKINWKGFLCALKASG